MQISTSDLRVITEKLLSHLEAKGKSLVEISSDFYWDVPQPARYDAYQQPTTFDLGQLTDDWKELEGILNGTASPTGYALVWLSSILRKVGESAGL